MYQKTLVLIISIFFVSKAFTQDFISNGVTNPGHYNDDVYGTPCQQIVRDVFGSIYVFGSYNSGSDNFDGLHTNDPGKSRFLAAYDSTRHIKWVRGVSSDQNYYGYMTYSPDGNIYFGSTFHDSIHIGNQFLQTPVAFDFQACIGKYDTAGNFIQAFQVGTDTTYESLYDLQADHQGNLAILLVTNATGNFLGQNIPFDPTQSITFLVVILDPSGAMLSSQIIGKSAYTSGKFSLSFEPGGDFYIGGGPQSGPSTIGGVSIPERMSSISRWHPGGAGPVWVKPLVSDNFECHIFDIKADEHHEIAFTGNYAGNLNEGVPSDQSGYQTDVLSGKMNENGQILWIRNGDDGSNFAENGFAVDVDTAGNLYITGVCHGALVFEGAGLCASGPAQAAFIARFNSDGSYGWGACSGTGSGTALVVEPDNTLFATGTTAGGISTTSTNYLQHLNNRSLSLEPLEKSKYCTGESIVLKWKINDIDFPAGTPAKIAIIDSVGTLLSADLPPVSGHAGEITYTLPGGLGISEQSTLFLVLSMNNTYSRRTTGFHLIQSPTPHFIVSPYPVCYGRDQWLQPESLYKAPDLVHWEPAGAFVYPDSIAAQLLNVTQNGVYTVTFQDTLSGCSAGDVIQTNVYDFDIHVIGPSLVYGVDRILFSTSVTGMNYGIADYAWSNFENTIPPVVIQPVASVQIYENTWIAVQVHDFYGCARFDTLPVQYKPARILRGVVYNHDSTTLVTSISVNINRKNAQNNALLAASQGFTDANGRFYAEIKGQAPDTVVYVQAYPDPVQMPMEAPVWYPHKYFIQNALPVNVSADTTDLPAMYLFDNQTLPDSDGIIAGYIESAFAGLQQSPGPVAGMILWIADPNGQPLHFTVTDQNGYFRFEHLPFGTYFLYVDRLKIDNNLAPSVKIAPAIPHQDQLHGTLTANKLILNGLISSVGQSSETAGYSVFPNPARKQLTLRTPVNFEGTVSIVSPMGGNRLVQKKVKAENGVVQLNVEELPAGAYILKIETTDGKTAFKKVIISTTL